MQKVVAPYLPGLVICALLLVVGLLIRQLADTGPSKVRGNTVMRFGVLPVLIALALWAILWFMEAWSSGAIEGWINSLQ